MISRIMLTKILHGSHYANKKNGFKKDLPALPVYEKVGQFFLLTNIFTEKIALLNLIFSAISIQLRSERKQIAVTNITNRLRMVYST